METSNCYIHDIHFVLHTFIFFYCCPVHFQQMHSFILKKHIKIYIKIHINIAPTVSVFGHHQGACTEPG